MCAAGAAAVHAGRYDALHFDLFNIAEWNFVRALMAERYADVPYRITRAV
jgi:hypothetical protein